jgi:hypothetical protein
MTVESIGQKARVTARLSLRLVNLVPARAHLCINRKQPSCRKLVSPSIERGFHALITMRKKNFSRSVLASSENFAFVN